MINSNYIEGLLYFLKIKTYSVPSREYDLITETMSCIRFSLVCFGWSITNQENELKLPSAHFKVWLIIRQVLKREEYVEPTENTIQYPKATLYNIQSTDCLVGTKYWVLSICKIFLSIQILGLKIMCLSPKRKMPNPDWVQIISFLSWSRTLW